MKVAENINLPQKFYMTALTVYKSRPQKQPENSNNNLRGTCL